MTAVYRLLDASGNRAREGLRVIEDAVRMVRNDGWFSRELKELRHRLTTALRMLPEEALLASRDTPNDVGTHITIMSETMRGSANDVIAAAFKRLQESLRSLEEYGKIINGYFASRIEAIRYQSYTLEKAVRIGQFSQTTLEGRVLYLLLTEKLCHRPVGQTLREALRAGVGIVQIREKSMSDRRLLDHTRLVLDLAHEYDALVIMNDRPDLATLTQADGIHVGQDELTIAQVRQIAGPRPLVGVSTHSLQQAEAAVIEGASYIGVGPTFPTTTKEFVEYAGLEYVREVAREIDLPAYAIGGITTENAAEVVAAGATRLAVSSAICSAKEPYDAANQLLEILNGG
ncbi:thiamine-phosphate diphosphorylase [Planctopirus hydrillae]|uniref:Thiamine-phosphate synthase n=1 Tax=Planctopirus hydrillae TaxID=1841610 RepID=A0A1C3E8G0_9PLAN|nr:thiamine-phosphate diphosphorylase [Planctopirus hydrillae]